MDLSYHVEWIVALVGMFYLFVAPYTKVEESFNIQAMHDILYHGTSLEQFDHLEFPGVVPRTFIGPLLVSFFAWPAVTVISILGLSKLWSQYVVRLVLGGLVFMAWRRFKQQLHVHFGPVFTLWFTAISASQFHFIYYMSRPLPNTFALIFALMAFTFWLEQRHQWLIWSCGIAVVIFRSELCLLLGPLLLYDLVTRRIGIIPFLQCALPAGLLCLLATLTVDSIYWQRLLWPEGQVFWFNTYENQSGQWGVYPFLWYWYSALPRSLGLSLLLTPLGMSIDRRVQMLVTPGLLFVALYSFMPHKELRFIIYIVPLINVAAARACQFIWISRDKSKWRQLASLFCCLHVLANGTFSVFLLTISSYNYPGGLAMFRFHQVVPPYEVAHVHIDNLAAQTGVSRFTEIYSHWKYNKTENLKPGSKDIRSFTHILVEAKSRYAYNLKHYTNTHQVLDSVDAFSHLYFNYQHFPPVKIRVKPAIFILENLVEDDIVWDWGRGETEPEILAVDGSDIQDTVTEDAVEEDSVDDLLENESLAYLDLDAVPSVADSSVFVSEGELEQNESDDGDANVESLSANVVADSVAEMDDSEMQESKEPDEKEALVVIECNGPDEAFGVLTGAVDFIKNVINDVWTKCKNIIVAMVTFYLFSLWGAPT